MKWITPKNMWEIKKGREWAVYKGSQDLMEEMVAKDAIDEYRQLKVLKLED